MKRMKFLYKILPLLFALLLLNACEYEIRDVDKVKEALEVTASSDKIALDEDNLKDDIITFTWTDAREVPGDDFVVTYTTKLDVVGNNFGASTVILTYEDEGIYSRSFTSEQLQNWANEKWNLKVNQTFTLEFRVIAEWEGGATFEYPEVRQVAVDVQPIKVEVFDADKMFVSGSAIGGGDPIEMTKTLENESQYAWLGDLTIGELQIPVELDGMTYYIVPKEGDGTLLDGEGEIVKMQETPLSWDIETPGKYRVVVNMAKSVITIYSPAKALKPATVKWMLDGVEQTTIVEKLWRYGSDGWSWKEINFVPSLADPQIFVYKGDGISGRTKFGVANVNVAYVYTGGKTGGDTAVTHGKEYELFEGNGGSGADNPRNSYFSIPSGTNFIILDTRNMVAFFDKR